MAPSKAAEDYYQESWKRNSQRIVGEASVADDRVSCSFDGNRQLRRVCIDPSLLCRDELRALEGFLVQATNQALESHEAVKHQKLLDSLKELGFDF